MNSKSYSVLGWIVWQAGSRIAKRRMTQNRGKLGVAGAVALLVIGGALAAKSSDDD